MPRTLRRSFVRYVSDKSDDNDIKWTSASHSLHDGIIIHKERCCACAAQHVVVVIEHVLRRHLAAYAPATYTQSNNTVVMADAGVGAIWRCQVWPKRAPISVTFSKWTARQSILLICRQATNTWHCRVLDEPCGVMGSCEFCDTWPWQTIFTSPLLYFWHTVSSFVYTNRHAVFQVEYAQQ